MDPDTVAKGLSILTQVHARLFSGRIQSDRGSHQTVSEPKTMDPDTVAKAFVEHYYNTFDASRANLVTLYQETSTMTFQGKKHQGPASIVAKLMGSPFQQCKHAISTVDCQPSGPAGGMIVFVNGMLQLAGEEHHLRFSQIFSLTLTPEGSFVIQNDMLRLG